MICFRCSVYGDFKYTVNFDSHLTNVDCKCYGIRASGFVYKAQSVTAVDLLNGENMWNG